MVVVYPLDTPVPPACPPPLLPPPLVPPPQVLVSSHNVQHSAIVHLCVLKFPLNG